MVLRLLGTGAHGDVYEAEHRILGRRVAIKVLHPDVAASQELTARFVREARAVNYIRHPGVVDIYDIGLLPDGRPYCVMELLPGRTLADLLRERAPIPPAEVVAYLAPLCEALGAAHTAGVVHRDVKASNVMVLREGSPPTVKLLDFGVAKVVEAGAAGITTIGQQLGSLASMSPEQVRGQPVDARADVYALGVLLYQLLTGRLPFESTDPAEVERMHLDAPPPRPSALAPVPSGFDAVVARCLEKIPDRRFPSTQAVLEAAREALVVTCAETTRTVEALGVLVTCRAHGSDFEALGQQADVLDAAEGALREGGFDLPIGNGGTVLGVRLLAQCSRTALREVVTWARTLAGRLERPGVDVSVCVHVASATVREGPARAAIVGGPICDLEGWPSYPTTGFLVTPAALAQACAGER